MDNEIDLLQLVSKLMKRKWLILYITLVSMIIAVIYSYFIVKPLYEANVNIIICKEAARYFLEDRYTNSDISLYLQVIKTYEAIAMSRTVRHRVFELLPDDGFQEIKVMNASSKPGTQIITLTVSHPSAQNVAEYANVFAEQFIEVADEVLPAGELSILDKAERPKEPASPNRLLNITIFGMLGIMISIMVIFLLEYFKPVIDSEQDVKDCLGLSVLCVLPQDKFYSEEYYVT